MIPEQNKSFRRSGLSQRQIDRRNKPLQNSQDNIGEDMYSFGKDSIAKKVGSRYLIDINPGDARSLSLSALNDILSFMNSPFIKIKEKGFSKNANPANKGMLHFGIWMNNVKHYSGGRIHILLFAHILAEMGHKVTIITDMKPPFLKDFRYFEIEDRLNWIHGVDCNVSGWGTKFDQNNFDMVIASPRIAEAFSYSYKFNIPCAAILFETPNWIREFRAGGDSTDAYWEAYKKDILQQADMVLCNPGPTLDYAKEWLEDAGYDKPILPFPPAINTRIIDHVVNPVKENEITFIGRHLDFKCPDDVIKAVGNMKATPSINFIGSHNENIRKRMQVVADNNNVKIRFYSSIDDESKFHIIKRSKAVVIPTKFEGFGMPPAEAIYCKTAVVVYDLEVTRSIYGDSVKYAKTGDIIDLAKNIDVIFKMSPKKLEEYTLKQYEYMMSSKSNIPCHPYKIKNLVREYFYGKDYPTITAGMIVLNGLDTMIPTIKSIYEDVDEIIIVEGAVEDYATANPKHHNKFHSVDGTFEFLTDPNKLKEIDPRGIIKVVTQDKAFVDKNDMQNSIAELITSDLYIKVDADEVWKTEGIEYIRMMFRNKKELDMVKIKMHHFWKDVNTVAVGGQWDTFVPRVWRWNKAFRHPIGKGGFNYFMNQDTGQKVDAPNCKVAMVGIKLVYHLGYCRDNKHIQGKINYYSSRGIEKNVKNYYQAWKQGDPTNSTHPAGTTAEPFVGTLPAVLDLKNFPKIIVAGIAEVTEDNNRMLRSPLKGRR